MKRRDFITLIGGVAAWPLASRAQQPAIAAIGFLDPATMTEHAPFVTAFLQGLGEQNFAEGRNVKIEYRWAEGRNERLRSLADQLVALRVAVIAAPSGDSSAFAAKAATTTIPVVFSAASDPVANGLVASLDRPGGNLTGFTSFGRELMPKRLEILCEVVPNAPVVDLLVNPEGAITASATAEVEAAAPNFGRQIRIVSARNDAEIEAAFTALTQRQTRALLVMADSFFTTRAQRLVALALQRSIPTVFPSRDFTIAGGLLSYDTNQRDRFRQVGAYVGRILKGEKPSDLPVQRPTRIELIINMKTAKALGLTVPLSLLGRADEVIE
jgi:putative ABC transport system substrate-binding protein